MSRLLCGTHYDILSTIIAKSATVLVSLKRLLRFVYAIGPACLVLIAIWYMRPHAADAVHWLWDLDASPNPERMGVVSIAVFVSFLTIVTLWQIPPESTEALSKNPSPAPASPFSSRYAQTVLAGLGGLFIAEIARAVSAGASSSNGPAIRWFYIAWFVSTFFALLVLLNACRALAECLRAGATLQWRPPWHIYMLTFIDTFFNLIQGKNQTRLQVVEDEVIQQQVTLSHIADAVRDELARFLEKKLKGAALGLSDESADAPLDTTRRRIRVNISVLSQDRRKLFYISRTAGSPLLLRFPIESVAWIAVMAGVPRWYKRKYNTGEAGKIVLYDNSKGVIPFVPERQLFLEDYYQHRTALEDYEAFLVIPFPEGRELGPDDRRGALHISFRTDSDFETLWEDIPPYDGVHLRIPTSRAPDVNLRIMSTLAVLEPLIKGVKESLLFRGSGA